MNKKVLFAAAVFLLPCISRAQSFTTNSATNTLSVSVGPTANVGDTIGVFCGDKSSAQPTITSSGGEVFTGAGYHSTGTLGGQWFRATVKVANPRVTCNYPAQVAYASAFAVAVPGYQTMDTESSLVNPNSTTTPSAPYKAVGSTLGSETVMAVALCSSSCPSMWNTVQDSAGDGLSFGSVSSTGGFSGWNGQALLFTHTPATWITQAIGLYPAKPPVVVSMGIRIGYKDASGVDHSIDITPNQTLYTVSSVLSLSDGTQTVTPVNTVTLNVQPTN